MKKTVFCIVAALFMALLFIPSVQSASFKASGSGWMQQTSGTTLDLTSVSAVDGATAWAVGAAGTVLKTTDGSTWNPQAVGVTTNDLYGVSSLNTQNAFAVGDAGWALKTTNGADWVAVTTPT